MRGRVRTAALALSLMLAACLTLASQASARPGDLDPSYGSHGLATEPGGYGLTLDRDGKLLTLVGVASLTSPTELRRTNSDGTLDTEFGDGGTVRLAAGGLASGVVAVQPDGRIVVAAPDFRTATGPSTIHVFRTLPDGSLDPAFGGGDGEAVIDPEPAFGGPTDIAVAGSGRILLSAGYGADAVVIGIDSSGAIDPLFGTSGVAVVGDGIADAIESDPGGGFIVGWHGYEDLRMRVTKIDGDGQIDAAYARDGTRVLAGFPDDVEIAVSPTGRVAVGGTRDFYQFHFREIKAWIAVLDGAGDVASDFDPLPARTLPVPGFLSISDFTWDESGRLVVVGHGTTVTGPEMFSGTAYIARLRADGVTDYEFGDNGLGIFPQDFSTFPSDGLSEIALQSDGRILANAYPAVARFLADPNGQSDADADGVMVDDDACPRRYAETADGCQRASVRIGLKFRGGEFTGTVEAPRACRASGTGAETTNRKILLLRKRRGKDKVVRATRIRRLGFSFRLNPRGHTYYAKLPRLLVPGVVVCPGTRSRTRP